jgi:hypothetical protein
MLRLSLCLVKSYWRICGLLFWQPHMGFGLLKINFYLLKTGNCLLKTGSCLLKIGSCLLKIGSYLLKIGSCLLKIGSYLLKIGSYLLNNYMTIVYSLLKLLTPLWISYANGIYSDILNLSGSPMAYICSYSYPIATYRNGYHVVSGLSTAYPISIGCCLAYLLGTYKLNHLHCTFPLQPNH